MEFRILDKSDYAAYKILINDFRKTEFSEKQFEETLDYIQKFGNIYVGTLSGELIVTGTLLFEKKLIFDTCTLAHIEDVCVKASHRRLGYGKLLIKYLLMIAKNSGCYKVTLDCSDANVEFYKACGLNNRGHQMCELTQNL
jgi:glucosamine-phosphate N-acetyltransferase